MANKIQKIISGISIDILGTTISMVVGLLVVPFFFYYISKEEYGIWLAVSGLIALVSVIDVGVDQYLTTMAANDSNFFSDDLSDLIYVTLIIKCAIACLLLVIGFSIYFVIQKFLIIELEQVNIVRQTFLVALMSMIFNLFAATISTLLYSRHHFSVINSLVTISSILNSFGIVLFLALGFGICAFPLANLSSSLIQYACLFYFLITKYPHINVRVSRFNFKKYGDMIRYSFSFQILRWFHIVRTQYVLIAINNFVGPSAVALYNFTNRLPSMIQMVVAKIALPFFPTYAEYFSANHIEMAASSFLRINKFLFRFSLFLAIVCFSINRVFIYAWLGMDGFAGQAVLLVLLAYTLIVSAMGLFGLVIYSSKKFEKWTLVSLLEVIFAVILSWGLSFKFGLLGVVFGFVSVAILSQAYLMKIVLRQLHIPILRFLKTVISYSIFSNISTLIFALILTVYIEISDWVEIFFVCSLYGFMHLFFNEGMLIIRSNEVGLKAKLKSIFKF